jgi:hypothetical protein
VVKSNRKLLGGMMKFLTAIFSFFLVFNSYAINYQLSKEYGARKYVQENFMKNKKVLKYLKGARNIVIRKGDLHTYEIYFDKRGFGECQLDIIAPEKNVYLIDQNTYGNSKFTYPGINIGALSCGPPEGVRRCTDAMRRAGRCR